jgi:hypothetical protein
MSSAEPVNAKAAASTSSSAHRILRVSATTSLVG